MAELPLAGRRIWVTRPAAQAAALNAALGAAGAEVIPVPTLDIIAPADPGFAAGQLRQLQNLSVAVFISRNAVDWSQRLLGGTVLASVLRQLQVLAVGPATAAALNAVGVHSVGSPETGTDSEALLALPVLQPAAVHGRQVAIIRGVGGRELLAETLRARGAEPLFIEVYQRVAARQTAQLLPQLWRQQPPGAIVVSSRMGLDALLAMTPVSYRATLLACPLVAIGRHLPVQAVAAGFRHCLPVPAAAGDAAIVEALLANRLQHSSQ